MKIGFIGLGIMGKPMSKNLIKANYELIVMDKNPKTVKELSSMGAVIANSPKEVASQV
ncbi:MAG: NAD(P)-binding domain-containing protein, partial [Bacteroidota bacterium]